MSYITTIEFLQALYPDPVRPGKLMVWTRSRKSGKRRSHWLHTLGEAAKEAHRARAAREVFFSVPLHDAKKAVKLTRERWPRIEEPSARGSEDSAVALPALWAEIEVAGADRAGRDPGSGDHQRGDGLRPPAREVAFRVLEAISVPPSIIIDTGSGYQVYWLLRVLWLLETASDRARAGNLLRRLQGALHAVARASGLSIRRDADLARLMRMPDTFNLDWLGGKWIGVVHFPRVKTPGAGVAGDHRYQLADFHGLPEAPEEPLLEHLLRGAPTPRGIAQPVDLEPVVEGCRWLAHWLENAARLQGDVYQGVVGILSRCFLRGIDPRGLVHLFSKKHPGYNPVGTEEQIAQALQVDPPSCQWVGDLRDARETFCRPCPHFGLIETPLDLTRLVEHDPIERDPVADEHIERDAADCSRADNCLVSIPVTSREHEVNDQALAALAGERNLFERGGMLVEIVRPDAARPAVNLSRAAGSPVVRPIGRARLRELLARHCTFQAADDPARTAAPRSRHPPRWLVRALLARGSWPELPTLAGVVECPVLRPDGSVLEQPGYDHQSALVYVPSGELMGVPDAPNVERAEGALAELREAVCDFPFQSEAHFAAWLCSLLTPLARAAFSGPSPLNLIDANVRGCGKSLLVDICSVLLSGRPAARMSYPGSERELRKAITSLLLEAERTVLIDNVAGILGSPTLDRALTAETWRDRQVGSSRQVVLPLAITWYVTGNNVSLATDTARRCLHVRLCSPLKRPEKRLDFRHPRLLTWLHRERPRLLPAALTLLRAYIVAGRPPQPLEGWGSYESWSDLVRSTVVWLGLPDPAATREVLEPLTDQDPPHDLVFGLAELIDDLGGPATAKQILHQLATAPGTYPRLRSAIVELFPRLRDRELPTPIQLAGHLRALRGRMVHGACIDRLPKCHGGARWMVRKAPPPLR